jgi:hypothetical protein
MPGRNSIGVGAASGPVAAGVFSLAGSGRRSGVGASAAIDLIVAGRDEPLVFLFRGAGDGSFVQAQSLSFASGVGGFADIATGLVDDDLALDAVLSNPATNAILVLLGDGSLHLREAGAVAAGSTPGRILLDDAIGDPSPDLIVATVHGVVLLLGQGDGEFTVADTLPSEAAVTDLALFDADGDGETDIAAAVPDAGHVRIYRANGKGQYEAGPVFDLSQPQAIAAAELTGDARDDLVVANAGSVVLLRGMEKSLGPAEVIAMDTTVQRIVTADIDGDKRTDIVALDATAGMVHVLRSQGGGRFTPHRTIDATETLAGLAVADFDADGRLDIALSAPESHAVLLELEVIEPRSCQGDCDGNGSVTVDELVVAVNQALGEHTNQCPALDMDGNDQVTVDELVAAIGNALSDCR